jgi:hypothetical protein
MNRHNPIALAIQLNTVVSENPVKADIHVLFPLVQLTFSHLAQPFYHDRPNQSRAFF